MPHLQKALVQTCWQQCSNSFISAVLMWSSVFQVQFHIPFAVHVVTDFSSWRATYLISGLQTACTLECIKPTRSNSHCTGFEWWMQQSQAETSSAWNCGLAISWKGITPGVIRVSDVSKKQCDLLLWTCVMKSCQDLWVSKQRCSQ